MAFELDKLVRENVKRLTPYSSARSEFAGSGLVFLDANENCFGSPTAGDYSRYPDPLQKEIRELVAESSGVRPGQIFVGNGSDEAIDLLLRVFCRPGVDNILICPPTYGMYEVSAAVNDVAVRRAKLTSDFQLDTGAVQRAIDEQTKIIFLCSPNNPTGNLLPRGTIMQIARGFDGIVAVDEAYIHFSDASSLAPEIADIPNLVVLQTFSKAWGLAGLRVGLAFAGEKIIDLFNKIKSPYNVSRAAQELVLAALKNRTKVEATIARIVAGRKRLRDDLMQFKFVSTVYPSDANFLLVKVTAPDEVYRSLLNDGIVVRNRDSVVLCEGCLRITVGTEKENEALIRSLQRYEESIVH